MSRRRYYRKAPVKKHAKGESFAKELEKVGRYQVGISLVSLKTIAKYDVDRTNEFYFKVDGGKVFSSRVPSRGAIELRENQTFTAKADSFTLWSEFVKFKAGEEKFVKIKVSLMEEDPGKDDHIATKEFEIKCPSKTQYIILEPEDGRTKAKLKIYASKTIY